MRLHFEIMLLILWFPPPGFINGDELTVTSVDPTYVHCNVGIIVFTRHNDKHMHNDPTHNCSNVDYIAFTRHVNSMMSNDPT
jgi:hypothetical protein